MLIALPAHANSQETTVTPSTGTLPAVTDVLPDDGASAITTSNPTGAEAAPIDALLKPVVFADAIAAPAGQSMRDIARRPVLPPEPEARPPGLLALYAGFATLQALDAHSTVQAVHSGYEESNPLVAPFSQSPAAMYAFKAATTTVTILLVEKLRRRHRGAAIGLMVALNVGYASVVAHNYRQSAR
jgi:hypothetical protein